MACARPCKLERREEGKRGWGRVGNGTSREGEESGVGRAGGSEASGTGPRLGAEEAMGTGSVVTGRVEEWEIRGAEERRGWGRVVEGNGEDLADETKNGHRFLGRLEAPASGVHGPNKCGSHNKGKSHERTVKERATNSTKDQRCALPFNLCECVRKSGRYEK